MKEQRGQSLVEVVFSIGLIALVITGVVALLVSTIGSRTKSHERVRTAELSQIVLENLLSEKNTNSDAFWNIDSAFWVANKDIALTNPNFPGYDYIVSVTPKVTNGCTSTTCFDVVVSVGWNGSSDGSRKDFNRFFSKK